MENSKFAGNNIQLSIPARLGMLEGNERIDVTLSSDKVVQGHFDSLIGDILTLTLVGVDDKTMIKVVDIKKLDIPQFVPKAR